MLFLSSFLKLLQNSQKEVKEENNDLQQVLQQQPSNTLEEVETRCWRMTVNRMLMEQSSRFLFLILSYSRIRLESRKGKITVQWTLFQEEFPRLVILK
jgi:hypothetical protein